MIWEEDYRVARSTNGGFLQLWALARHMDNLQTKTLHEVLCCYVNQSILSVRWQCSSPSHHSTADEAWYWHSAQCNFVLTFRTASLIREMWFIDCSYIDCSNINACSKCKVNLTETMQSITTHAYVGYLICSNVINIFGCRGLLFYV